MSRLFIDDGPDRGHNRQKVCLATTVYDRADASYTFSIARSRAALSDAGIDSAYYLLQGNCHVDDARNRVVQEFMLSDCSDLVFLDADVSWAADSLVRLCEHQGTDIVGGVYPYRRDDRSNEMPVRMRPGSDCAANAAGLVEVDGLPAGFMRIGRHVLEVMIGQAAGYWNREDRRAQIPILFQRILEGDIRWGGDLQFCNEARRCGFKVQADDEMVLSHTGTATLRASLASARRRREMATLRHVCDKIRAGTETLADITEARDYVRNSFTATEDVLVCAVKMAREADGPILEVGSGLSTILMAAATEQTVYCLEHHAHHASALRQMSAEAGVTNIGLCVCEVEDGWYCAKDYEGIPGSFAMALLDGPPRHMGSRLPFFDRFPGIEIVLCDDADNPDYRAELERMAKKRKMATQYIEPRCLIMRAA